MLNQFVRTLYICKLNFACYPKDAGHESKLSQKKFTKTNSKYMF